MSLDELIEEHASAAAGPSHTKTLIRLYHQNKHMCHRSASHSHGSFE